MIFAAGLGSRLKPITNKIPKALVKVNNKELLAHNLEKFKKAGIHQVVINVHHFADQILTFLKQHNNFGLNILISDETELLRDTGGGLRKARELLYDCNQIVIQNVDIFSNIDYQALISVHQKEKALATLAVRNRESSRYFLFDKEKCLRGWKNTKTNEKIIVSESSDLNSYAFSGIHVIDSKLLKMLPDKDVFSIVKIYLELAQTNNICAYLHDTDYWFDIGSVEKLKRAEEYANKLN